MQFFIDSEVKPLKAVLVNTPDPSLDRLNPSNYRELLLEDTVSSKNIADEFKIFTDILKANNVEVFYFKKLFKEVLVKPEARSWLFDFLLNRFSCEQGLMQELKAYLNELSAEKLCSVIINGLSKKSLGLQYNKSLSFELIKDDDFILSPLPNQIYVRDLFVLLYDFVVFGVMSRKARINESYNIQSIYKFHPLFQQDYLKVCYGSSEDRQYHNRQQCLEGGDLMMVNENIAIFAASQRTSIFAIESITKKLLKETKLKSVIVLETKGLKEVKRHLDTIVFFLDIDKVALYLDVLRFSQVLVVSLKDDLSLNINKEENLLLALEGLLGFRLKVIPINEEDFQKERSLLSIKPGTVISYAGLKFNDALRYYGVEVLEFECQELLKLNGATHGLACPILRA